MLRTVVACKGHRVRALEAEELDLQSSKRRGSACSSSEQTGESSAKAKSTDSSSTIEDPPSLSDVDGIEPLEGHWRDEDASKPSHKVFGDMSRRLSAAVHPALGTFDRRTTKGKIQHDLWLKEAKQDWEREVLRVDLS